MSFLYITHDLTTSRLRVYSSKEEATAESLALNEASEDHPAFHLWELAGAEIKYLGRLWRPFGRDFDRENPWNESVK